MYSFFRYGQPLSFGVALITFICFSSCKKTDGPDANTNLLAAHPWRVVGFLDTDNQVQPPQTVDKFLNFPASSRDDTYQFNANGGLLFDDGPLRRNTTDPQTSTGSWQFRDTQQSLDITLRRAVALGTTGITSTTTYCILKLSADSLHLTDGTQAQRVVVKLAR